MASHNLELGGTLIGSVGGRGGALGVLSRAANIDSGQDVLALDTAGLDAFFRDMLDFCWYLVAHQWV
jgi:hypothetical protein